MEINAFLEHNTEDTPNIILVKNQYKALNEGFTDELLKILSERPTWNVCPGNPDGGTYCGMAEVFDTFYTALLKHFHSFKGEPEVFIDGGDVVTTLGFYSFKVKKGGPIRKVRFSHTFKITSDNRVDAVWQAPWPDRRRAATPPWPRRIASRSPHRNREN